MASDNSTSSLPAQAFLKVIFPSEGCPSPTDAAADKAIDDLLAHLDDIQSQHCKKAYSDEHLMKGIFVRSQHLKADPERTAYCRYHLIIAIRRLKALLDTLRTPSNNITVAVMEKWKEVLRDYIFDLNEIIPYLQRNVAGYVFYPGGKNSNVHSWEIYIFSRSLAYQSTFRGTPPQFNHKTSQIGSILILRQALEIRFERLVGVYLYNAKGKGPRLRHGFHQEFINSYPQFFHTDGFCISDLQTVYDWCSEIVHQAYQPYTWQIDWALELCDQLLGAKSVPPGSDWSIANGVEIIDVTKMQAAFETYFLTQYGHGSWRMTRTRPEALVRDWMPDMATISTKFRPVLQRRSALNWTRSVLLRLGRKSW